jgi:uncharacterized protein with HEPN domain
LTPPFATSCITLTSLQISRRSSTPASFKHDIRTVYAVTRCLEIISEASRRLPDDLKARHPAIGWKQMAGAGNVYRHDYEDVAAEFVWETVQRALPPLRAVIEVELKRGA